MVHSDSPRTHLLENKQHLVLNLHPRALVKSPLVAAAQVLDFSSWRSEISIFSTSAQGPTQWGPIQKRTQGEFLQFFLAFSPWNSCFPVSYRRQKHVLADPFEWAPLLKCFILIVASAGRNPTMIRVPLSCGRALSERAPWLLLIFTERDRAIAQCLGPCYFPAETKVPLDVSQRSDLETRSATSEQVGSALSSERSWSFSLARAFFLPQELEIPTLPLPFRLHLERGFWIQGHGLSGTLSTL